MKRAVRFKVSPLCLNFNHLRGTVTVHYADRLRIPSVAHTLRVI